MKLSKLRPCNHCGGAIAPMFYVIRVSQAMVKPSANQTLGLNQMFGGNALGLAEVMSPSLGEDVMVFGDENPDLMHELLYCQDCTHMELTQLMIAIEAQSKNEEKPEDGV